MGRNQRMKRLCQVRRHLFAPSSPKTATKSGVGSRVENLPPHINLHYPVVDNLVDAMLVNDPQQLRQRRLVSVHILFTTDEFGGTRQKLRDQC